MVCAYCGSTRIGVIQMGIDNWPVAQCFECGPKVAIVPESDGTEKNALKRAKAINRHASRRTSKKAIHTVLRPVVPADEYRPRAKPEAAPAIGMFD